jgi:hypothetical protein
MRVRSSLLVGLSGATVYPDAGHGFIKHQSEIRGYTAILEFLDKHLKGTTAADAR